MNEQEKIEQSLENCDEHYSGEIALFEKFLEKLRAGTKPEELEKWSESNSQVKDAHSHGTHDASKIVKTAIDYLKDGQITKEEVEKSIQDKIDRINRLIG